MKRGRGVSHPPPSSCSLAVASKSPGGRPPPPTARQQRYFFFFLAAFFFFAIEVVTPFPEKTHDSRAADYFRLPFLVAFFLPPFLTAFLRFGMWGLTSLPSGIQ